MQPIRVFEPGDLDSAAEFIREVAETHPRVYVEVERARNEWELVCGDEAVRATKHLQLLCGTRRFRIRGVRLR